MRPLIGITAYVAEATWSYWRQPAALIPLAYVRAVEEAGGRPLIVPPSDETIEETLDALHGLVFSGGADLDPALYGSDRHPATSTSPERDQAEMALMKAALARDLPTLAICRGMQLLNVVRGGTLIQHLPEPRG
ncbi:MAG: type 1 glutamine amidotransferase [Actinobacteria bacterium]|nr:type 1 glutamine amidotransferase [Actinomycetota bacterium]